MVRYGQSATGRLPVCRLLRGFGALGVFDGVWGSVMKTVGFGVLLIVGVLGAGCADKSNQIRTDIKRLDRGLGDLRSVQAQQVADLSALRSEVRGIAGRLDEIDHTSREKLGGLSSIRNDLNQLSRRLPPPAIVPELILEADEALVSSMPGDIQAPFAQMLAAVRAGGFQELAAPLQELADQTIESEYAPLVMFWSGITAEGTGDLNRAIGTYIDLVGRFPKHPRASVALFRQASALMRVGDKKTARLAFKKLVADYPKSPDAVRARERLKAL